MDYRKLLRSHVANRAEVSSPARGIYLLSRRAILQAGEIDLEQYPTTSAFNRIYADDRHTGRLLRRKYGFVVGPHWTRSLFRSKTTAVVPFCPPFENRPGRAALWLQCDGFHYFRRSSSRERGCCRELRTSPRLSRRFGRCCTKRYRSGELGHSWRRTNRNGLWSFDFRGRS